LGIAKKVWPRSQLARFQIVFKELTYPAILKHPLNLAMNFIDNLIYRISMF